MDYTLYLGTVTHELRGCGAFTSSPRDLDLDLERLRFQFARLPSPFRGRGRQARPGVSPLSLSVWKHAVPRDYVSSLEREIAILRSVVNRDFTAPMTAYTSIVPRRQTKWSTAKLWDRLHGTLRLNVPQQEIIIGVPAYRQPQEVTLKEILEMPFGEERPTWRFQLAGGAEPARTGQPFEPDHLLA